jgi:DNA-binding winged helix-turn-helix (wHTH) protein
MPRYTFGSFSLDPEARTLLRDGELLPIAGKTLDTLLVLVQNRGRLVDKDELLSRIWPDTMVEEANLSQSIFTVRKVLGDSPKDHRYIATIAGRGYQFVAPVTELVPAELRPGERIEVHPFWRRNRMIQLGTVAATIALIPTAWLVVRESPKQPADLTQKRLTFNSDSNPIRSAVISPDGQYLAYSDPAAIHVKLLSTGEERLIPRPATVPTGALWDVDSWFPNGTHLLVDSEVDGNNSMWSASVLGQSTRKLRGGATGWEVSPDGTQVVFSPSEPFQNLREVWVMGSEGENPHKVLRADEHESLCAVHWSPDGQRLAYIRTKQTSEKLSQ